MRRTAARLIMAGGFAAVGAVAGGAEPGPAFPPVKVEVRWDGGNGPTDVVFDDPGGEQKLTQAAGRYIGERKAAPPAAYLLFIRYGTRELPFGIRTAPGMDPVVITPFDAYYPQCPGRAAMEALNQQTAVTLSQTKAIETMARARQIYLLQTSACPTPGRAMAARVYFTVNCNLAKRYPAYDLMPEAGEWYINSMTNPAAKARVEREVSDCKSRVQAKSLAVMNAYQLQLKSANNLSGVLAVNNVLDGLAKDVAWRGGFAAARLDADLVAATRVDAIYDSSIAAAKAGDLAEAVKLNGDLVVLKQSGDFDNAFRAVGIDDARLADDKAFLNTRLELRQDRAAPQ